MEKGILTREKNAKNNLFPAKSGVRKKCVRKVLIKNEEPSLFKKISLHGARMIRISGEVINPEDYDQNIIYSAGSGSIKSKDG